MRSPVPRTYLKYIAEVVNVAVVVDRSRPRELAHAVRQAGRLRRAGFGVVGPSAELPAGRRDSVGLLHAVGPAAWRSARRLARRSRKPVLYDHPPGFAFPRGLAGADRVIVAGRTDAEVVQGRLKAGGRVVVIPPLLSRWEPGAARHAVRPRLRERLGIAERAMALQEAADISPGQARALIEAIGSLAGVELVFLGGARWPHRDRLRAMAGEMRLGDRVHFVPEAPLDRRLDYLNQADIGLALADRATRPGRLPAADAFELLGVPFVAADAPASLAAAIAAAGERGRMPARDDGDRLLGELVVDLVGPAAGEWRPAPVAQPRAPAPVPAVAEADAVPAEVDAAAEPSSPAVLRAEIRDLEKSGEPRAGLRLARRAGDETSVARLAGTLQSYDPSWLPRGEQRATPIVPVAGRSLVLLETSLPQVRSGYTYRARTVLRAQRAAGIEPVALTRLGFPFNRGLESPPEQEVDGVVHHRSGLPGVQRYTSVPVPEQLETNVRWAATVAREHRPEGIVATTPHLNALVGLSLRRALGVPVVYAVRGFPEMTWAVREGGGESEVYGLRRIAETRCMREADLVTTLSETMRRHIVSRGIAPEKVLVLPHAVDTTEFAPKRRDRELAASLGLGDRKVVGYISSLVAYEGVETLLDALALARREDPGVAGLVVGDGDLLPALEARATRLGLDRHVVFTGRVDSNEITRYYSLIDVFVCPRDDHEVTRYVTPLKPFEAMAAGSCLVVSDLPALREAVRDGECGALFPAGDADALAATIRALLDDPGRRRELAAAAREHAVARHGFETLRACQQQVWSELRLRSRNA